MKIYAHRGYSGKYPENTMLAFQKAYETGCDGIELDVQLTKDGVPVIMHDEKIDRTTNGTGWLMAYTYQELCQFDCYGKFPGQYEFQKIPTLEEYLTWVAATDLVTNIELKNGVYYYEKLEEKVIDLVKKHHLKNRVIFSSFNPVSILKCKKMLPHVPMGFLAEGILGNVSYFTKSCGVEFFHPDLKVLTREVVEDCHEKGVGINVWTVNKKEEIARMLEWDVDGIFTNYPDRAKEVIQG